MAEPIVIFSHYGDSSYLKYALACARKTNKDSRLILLGDQLNRDTALASGWEHYAFDDFRGEAHDRFNRVFRHVQGKKHGHLRAGRDWLRYVFERWFFIEGFCVESNIDRFWHFDSDTMILQSLVEHDENLSGVDFTVQCNGTCLNGVVTTSIVVEFCKFICDLFEDSVFLDAQQREFDTEHPEFAFTEMRAFDSYKAHTQKSWLHLLNYRDDLVFDDCICQGHGFEMQKLRSGERVKTLWVDQGRFYGNREGERVEFVTLNLSWVPDYVFEWVLNSIEGVSDKTLAESCPPSLKFKQWVKRVKHAITSA